MKSRRTPGFRTQLAALPEGIQREAQKAYELFEADPGHPSLTFERIQTRLGPCHSARIGLHYRALAVQRSGYWLWFWIGSHAEYDRLRK